MRYRESERNTTRAAAPTVRPPASRSSTIACTQTRLVSATRKIGAPGTTVEPTSRLRVTTKPAMGLAIRVSVSRARANPSSARAVATRASPTRRAVS